MVKYSVLFSFLTDIIKLCFAFYYWKPKFPNSSCINILIILINIELVEKINY